MRCISLKDSPWKMQASANIRDTCPLENNSFTSVQLFVHKTLSTISIEEIFFQNFVVIARKTFFGIICKMMNPQSGTFWVWVEIKWGIHLRCNWKRLIQIFNQEIAKPIWNNQHGIVWLLNNKIFLINDFTLGTT